MFDFNTGDSVKITASKGQLKSVGAELILFEGQETKVIKTFPDGYVVVEAKYLDTPCTADIPSYFLKKV